MAEYGIVSTGFNRKPLAVGLAEIEEGMVGVFGPLVIQTPQSPFGQLNGLMADLIARLWEVGEDVYQSYDPDQSEGVPLERIARLRLLERAPGESDASLRQATTNAGRARIDLEDLRRAVQNIDGVTYVQVFVNDTSAVDANGLEPHSISVAVLGGDDDEIALALRSYIVPGIGSSGNVRIDTLRNGVCRSFWLTRPVLVPITLDIEVIRRADSMGCPPAALTAIAEGLIEDLNSARRPINGEDVTVHLIRSAIEARYPNVEVTSVAGSRAGDSTMPLAIGFNEIASFSIDNITVENAP